MSEHCDKVGELPSKSDLSLYFLGLAGCPKLIARSGQDLFVPRVENAFSVKKSLYNIGPHPFIDIYEQTPLRKLILDALANISWYKIDFVRLGCSDIARENPVVILITVKRGTPNAMGQEAVNMCRKACIEYELDIHTEMKDGDGFCDNMMEDSVPLIPRKIPLLGESLGPRLSGTAQASGTLGLYITIENKTGKVRCAVTCHHVVFPAGLQNPPGKFIGSSLYYDLWGVFLKVV